MHDGRVFITSGSDLVGGILVWRRQPEIYDPSVPPSGAIVQTPAQALMPGGGDLGYYPYVFIFRHAGIPAIFWLGGHNVEAYRIYPGDLSAGWTRISSGNEPPAGLRQGSAVMYLPGKVMKSGGGNVTINGHVGATNLASTVDLNQTNPVWSTPTTMNYRRKNHTLVLLADGTVLCRGGNFISDQGLEPEDPLYDHYDYRKSEIWDPATNTWHLQDAAMAQYRRYHSIGLLLKTGEVFVGGGNWPEGAPPTYQRFTPHYLQGNPTRPVITSPSVPFSVAYSGYFNVTMTFAQGKSISKIALVRLGSVTHGLDQNQRYVPLTNFTQIAQNTFRVQAPTSSTDAPPGNYYLFVFDDSTPHNVPSVAQYVKITSVTP